MRPRPVTLNGKTKHVICIHAVCFKVNDAKPATDSHKTPSEWSKPDQQVGETDRGRRSASTHVSRDEVPNGAEIHPVFGFSSYLVECDRKR